MDDNISYDCASDSVDTSVRLLDVSAISDTLQRFPVLQIRASHQLIREIPRLIKISGKVRLLRSLADAIGCIVAPCGLLTTEHKLCATNLYYGIGNLDENVLQLLIRRLLEAKRDCFGSGLFVQTALTEILQLTGKLPHYLRDIFFTDEWGQFETEIYSWKQVLDLVQREGFIKDTKRISEAKLPDASNIKKERKRRLYLEIGGRNGMHKRRKREGATLVCSSPGPLETRKERELFLRLVTLYAAYPNVIAEKIRARGLQSYCSAKILALRDSLSSSEVHQFTSDELRGMRVLGSANFDASMDTASMRSSDIPESNVSSEISFTAKDGRLLSAYKVWMPLAAGIESLVHSVQNGCHDLDAILKLWISAQGGFLSSVDQIMMAALAHDRMLETLLGYCFSGEQSATASKPMNGMSNTQVSLVLSTVRECLKMVDIASGRGFRYPIAFWGQCVKVYTILESAVVLLLLHDVSDSFVASVTEVISHARHIARRLENEDCVEYLRTEPSKNAAVVKICDCLSMEMHWKDKRRILRRSILRPCSQTKPNGLFLRIPKPGLWFFWVTSTHGLGQEARSVAQGTQESISISRWLYGNPGWRDRDYCFSKLEILHGIVDCVLRKGGTMITSEMEDLVAHVLKYPSTRNSIFSVFVERSKEAISELDIKCNEKLLQSRLRLVRTGVEKIWSIIGHKSKLPLFNLNSAVSSDKLGHIEEFLITVSPLSRDIHDCVGDMRTFCEFIAGMYQLLNSRQDMTSDNSVRLKIIAGLMYSQRCRKTVSESRKGRQDRMLQSVMCCFE